MIPKKEIFYLFLNRLQFPFYVSLEIVRGRD